MRHHLFAFLVAGSVAGCAVPGERATDNQCWSNCASTCPEGEDCSSDTPTGLYFGGSSAFDRFSGGPHTIAIGGVQRIGIYTSSNMSESFESPFDAEGTGAFEVTEVEAPEVTVRADSAGEGYLRILEPGTDKLYDRVALHAAPVELIEMTPAGEIWANPDVPASGWSLFAGAAVQIGVRLRGKGPDDVLVDESMTVAITSGAAPGEKSQIWDLLHVVPDASGEVTLLATLGDGSSHSQSFPIAEKIDGIVRVASFFDQGDDPILTPKAGTTFCFGAMDGKQSVAGVAWTFAADADVKLEPLAPCVSVQSAVLGPHTLTVQAGGFELPFKFEVVQSAAPAPPKKAQTPPNARTSLAIPGERSAAP